MPNKHNMRIWQLANIHLFFRGGSHCSVACLSFEKLWWFAGTDFFEKLSRFAGIHFFEKVWWFVGMYFFEKLWGFAGILFFEKPWWFAGIHFFEKLWWFATTIGLWVHLTMYKISTSIFWFNDVLFKADIFSKIILCFEMLSKILTASHWRLCQCVFFFVVNIFQIFRLRFLMLKLLKELLCKITRALREYHSRLNDTFCRTRLAFIDWHTFTRIAGVIKRNMLHVKLTHC